MTQCFVYALASFVDQSPLGVSSMSSHHALLPTSDAQALNKAVSSSSVTVNNVVLMMSVLSVSNPVRNQFYDLRMYQVASTMVWIGSATADCKIIDFVIINLIDQSLLDHALVIVRQSRVV